MRWFRRERGGAAPALETPLDDIGPSDLEVLEVDDTGSGRLTGLGRWKDDDSLREVTYTVSRDPGSLAGIWEGLARS